MAHHAGARAPLAASTNKKFQLVWLTCDRFFRETDFRFSSPDKPRHKDDAADDHIIPPREQRIGVGVQNRIDQGQKAKRGDEPIGRKDFPFPAETKFDTTKMSQLQTRVSGPPIAREKHAG